PIIYHMCPQSAWDEVKHEPTGTYVPEGFDKVGFIHCTSIATGLLNVANHFYKGSKEAWICLEIDAAACAPAKVIWEPPAPVAASSLTGTAEDVKPDKEWEGGVLLPHVYGHLNVAAVTKIYPIVRDMEGDGTFKEITGLAS
ncbi:unnamed protein product, partial [Polarella glacialis]